MAITPTEGVLNPGQEMEVTVTLDASDLRGMVYEAALHFQSNDMETPDYIVPVSMEVTDAAIMDVRWAEEIGYPNVINWNVAYEDLIIFNEFEVSLNVFNHGTDNLEVIGIDSDNPDIVIEPPEFVVEPNAEQQVILTFTPEDEGDHSADLIITWNNPHEDDLVIPMAAFVADPPVISVEPDEIVDDIFSREIRQHPLTLTNDGGWLLRYQVQYLNDEDVWLGEPGFSAKFYHTSGGHNPEFRELGHERIDRHINFNWGNNAPAEGVNADNFGVRWEGYIHAEEAGVYNFRTITDDGVRVYIDDEIVMNHWHGNAQQRDFDKELDAGVHIVVMEMYDQGGPGRAHFYWRPPGVNDWVLLEAFADAPWVNVEPDNGTVAPGQELELTVSFNSNGMEVGEYDSDLHILSNDPEEDDVIIPVQVTFGEEPLIEVAWSEEFGFLGSLFLLLI